MIFFNPARNNRAYCEAVFCLNKRGALRTFSFGACPQRKSNRADSRCRSDKEGSASMPLKCAIDSKMCRVSCFLLLAVCCLFFHSAMAVGSGADGSRGLFPTREHYRNQALAFEANAGQVDGNIAFLAYGRDYSLWLAGSEASLSLGRRANSNLYVPLFESDSSSIGAPGAPAGNLHIGLRNARRWPDLSGENLLPGTINYFIGSDPAEWKTAIPTYAKVRYSGIYPGVDLVYYGNQQQLEFDFDVAPGANPRQIGIDLGGARKLTLDADGDLNIATGAETIVLRKPVAYQESNGIRTPVPARFSLRGKHEVGFTLGTYNRKLPLVIDPILVYSTYLGDASGATAVAVDAAGNAYVTGYTDSGFPVSSGAYEGQPNEFAGAGVSAFITKFDPSGNLIYSTYLGGSVFDAANTIAVDAAGNAYVGGITASPDFPVTPGVYQTVDRVVVPAGYNQTTGFVTKLNPTGTGLVYSTFLGGSTSDNPVPPAQGQEQVMGIAVDSSGAAFVTGYTFSTDFPTTPGAFQTTNPGIGTQSATYFATKLNPAGAALDYSTFLGGKYYGGPPGIAIDGSGSAYIAGTASDPTFPTTPGAYQTKYTAAIGMASLSKLNPTGTGLVYSTYLGASYQSFATAVAVDSAGNAYVTGNSTDHDDFPFTPGAVKTGVPNVIISKFNPTGSALVYSAGIGQNPGDIGKSIVLDAAGDAYVSGQVGPVPFPTTAGAFQTEDYYDDNGIYGSFVAKLNPTATVLDYSTFLTGTGTNPDNGEYCDCINGMAIDLSGNIIVAGQAVSDDFPTTPGALQPGSYLASNIEGTMLRAFVTKFDGSEMTTLPLTNLTLTENANPQTVDLPVAITAKVTPAAGNGVPTGSMFFASDLGILCNAPVDNTGAATCTTSVLHPGPNPIRVTYYGDANDAPGDADLVETMQYIPTITTLGSDGSTVMYGSSATITATVKPTTGTGIPTGIAFFSVPCAKSPGEDSVPLNSSGVATCLTATNIPIGNYVVTAMYGGDGLYGQSTSAGLPLTVQPLGVTQLPTFTPPGGTYTQTVDVTMGDPNSNATIYFTTDGSTPTAGNGSIYQQPLIINSTETINAVAVAPGYSPSAVESVTYVLPPNFTISLASNSLFVQAGQPATDVITVGSVFGFAGQVNFGCSGLASGTSCSFTPATVTPTSGSLTTTTLTISATTAAALDPGSTKWLPITSLALVLGAWGFRKRRGLGALLLVVGVSIAVTGVSSCGGGSGGGNGVPQEVISTVTVTGTSGSVQNSATATVTLTK